MVIAKGFKEKNFTVAQRHALETAGAGDGEIVIETEKAIKFKIKTDFGIIGTGIPKSVITFTNMGEN